MRAFKIRKFTFFAILLIFVCPLVRADIYRCSSPSGAITLSNVKTGEKNCEKMNLPPLEARKKINSPEQGDLESAGKSREKSSAKSSYDTANAERKRIINEEIELEKTRANAAGTKLKELTSLPNKTPQQLKDLEVYKKEETSHRSNIDLLKNELGRQ